MNINEFQIQLVKPSNGLIGFCSFVIDDCFYMSSVAIYSRLKGGYRLVYPTKKGGNKDVNIFHPINKEVGELLEQKVTEELTKLINI